MAHFAKVDENNKVVNVVVVDNSEVPDEATGIAFCENTLGPGTYLQTSYNTLGKKHYTDGELSADQSKAFRGNYAEIDGYYLPDENHFQPVQPFPSWTWTVSTASWTPPVAKPETDAEAGMYWDWDEDAQNWVQIHIEID
jgi:hypothetical protein|tara:strand:+ start:126 stop:545 length:420 start_codon:yes stop_codon:yes gene_type:complete